MEQRFEAVMAVVRDGRPVTEVAADFGVSRQRLIEPARQRRRKDWVRWERHRPMELWQMDVVGGIVLADGTELKALTGIDDHSRFCVCAGLMEHARSRAVCGHFVDAMREHGVPDEVLTDNGKVFTGRHSSTPSEVLFD